MRSFAQLAACAVLTLAGCARAPSAAEKAAADARDVAEVKAINSAKPPAQPLLLQPIRFDDIQSHRLFEPGCAFAPGGSMGAVLLAQDKAGYVKVAGRMVRLASDSGSERLPLSAWTCYTGKAFAVRLARQGVGAAETGAVRWPGRLIVTDSTDQVVYAADGSVQCGS